jgi:hypothetical protein
MTNGVGTILDLYPNLNACSTMSEFIQLGLGTLIGRGGVGM